MATGRYSFTSTIPAAQIVESSSSSSPGEDNTVLGVRMSAFNILSTPFEAGSSAAPQYANIRATQISDSPSPTPEISNVGDSTSGSGHSSGGKRPRSPEPTTSRLKNTPSFGGRRRKPDAGLSVISEMVEIGRQKLELAREIYQSEKTSRSVIPTIQDCMTRVYAMPGITPERVLVAGDALKDPNNRQLFMTMTDNLAVMWVDRQVAMQNVLYKQYFSGL